MSTNNEAHHDALGHHITPLKVYWTVFAALMIFTVLTVAVSVVPQMLGISMGVYALPVALTVALFKAGLVATFFMHLKYDERFNAVIFVSCLFFMGIFFAFTMMDLATRGLTIPEEAHGYMAEEEARAAAADAAIEAAAAAEPATEESGEDAIAE
ncbi:MAG: cytochrome c oxidase subunit 4 [Bradymonadia bacterium]|jgi:cytochrome c oxidase subunit 4